MESQNWKHTKFSFSYFKPNQMKGALRGQKHLGHLERRRRNEVWGKSQNKANLFMDRLFSIFTQRGFVVKRTKTPILSMENKIPTTQPHRMDWTPILTAFSIITNLTWAWPSLVPACYLISVIIFLIFLILFTKSVIVYVISVIRYVVCVIIYVIYVTYCVLFVIIYVINDIVCVICVIQVSNVLY